MHRTNKWAVIAGALAWAWLPAVAHAQTSDNWQFRAFVYGYLPDIGGSTSFPAGASSSVNIDANTLISNLKFTFMGTFEASKGRYGFITDILYLNVGGSQSNTRNLNVNGRELPVGVSSNVNLDIEGTVWTLGGEYHAIAQPAVAVDVIAGARLLDLKQTLGYSFTADVGPITGPGRSGSSEVKISYWDAIVGAEGPVRVRPQPRMVRSGVRRRGHRPVEAHLAGPGWCRLRVLVGTGDRRMAISRLPVQVGVERPGPQLQWADGRRRIPVVALRRVRSRATSKRFGRDS